MGRNERGFGVTEIIIAVVVVGLIVATGWYLLNRNDKPSDSSGNNAQQSSNQEQNDAQYLVVEEFGVRFALPDDLTDVRYVVDGDTARFFAKPAASSVEYRDDYEGVSSSGGEYHLATLYRSSDSTRYVAGDIPVEGKKLGDSYYYTGWSFSGLATGRGFAGLYFDEACDNETGDRSERCQSLIDAEDTAFKSLNEALRTLELSQ
jgi:hypothetical protein